MRILMHSEEALTVSGFNEPGFHVDAEEHAHAHFSALQMFATSFAVCTASVLVGYGEQIKVNTDSLRIRMTWRVADKPNRISDVRQEVVWPDLPESRVLAAERAAAQCTVHNTLHQPPDVKTSVRRAD